MHHRDMETSIQYLLTLIPNGYRSIVEQRCRENMRLYPQPERSSYTINDHAHRYGPNLTEICPGSRGSEVFEAMKDDGRCSAPTYSKAGIFTGKIEHLFPAGDMVVKLVDQANKSIYNVTLPKHVFFPGIVKLDIVEAAAMTGVSVSGQGKGNLTWFNVKVGPLLFRKIFKDYLIPKFPH